MSVSTQEVQIKGIDSLRGVSALYVLIYHLPLFSFGVVLSPSWLTPLINGGGSGVLLFFLISAFTLSRSLEFRAGKDANPLLAYAVRRIFRIAPLFFVWMGVYMIRDPVVYGVYHSPAELLSNVTFLFNLNPRAEAGIVAGSWTIGVEMIFYALLPLLLRVASNVGKTFVLLVLSMLLRMVWHTCAAGVFGETIDPQQAYAMSLLVHLPTFLIGIFTYRLLQAIGTRVLVQYSLGYASIAASIALLGTVLYHGPVCSDLDPYTVLATALALLLGGVCINPAGLLVNRVFGFYGKISFSIYLCHIPLILMLGKTIGSIYNKGWPIAVAYTCTLTLVMAIVTAVASITFYLVERPGMRVGRRIISLFEAAEAMPLPQGSRA